MIDPNTADSGTAQPAAASDTGAPGLEAPETPTASKDNDLGAIGGQALFGPGGPGAKKFNLDPTAPICDLVMKGGVTSGVVYPYAILRLAQNFRIAGIGGTSAGAIAASLAAAAEYGRQIGIDQRPAADGEAAPAEDRTRSFSRFEQWCLQIPDRLASFFQPVRKHRPVFTLATALMEALDPSPSLATRTLASARLLFSAAGLITWSIILGAFFGGVLAAIRYVWFYGKHIGKGPIVQLGSGPHATAFHPGWATFVFAGGVGLLSGLSLIGWFALAVRLKRHWPLWLWVGFALLAAIGSLEGGLGSLLAAGAPAALGGSLGALAVIALTFDQLVTRLRETDFGMCSGLTEDPRSGPPGLTDWLHAAIQDIAGLPLNRPLTFGDVEGAVSGDAPRLKLRMIVTNLTLRRPFALPDFTDPSPRSGKDDPRMTFGWRPCEWAELFPRDIVQYLEGLNPDHRELSATDIRELPSGDRLPVLVGARMSLSFPLLFRAVPVYDFAEFNEAQPSEIDPDTKKKLSRRRFKKAVNDWRRRGRMLMIDGGLSSNMPLHFFDNLGPPAYPTFAFNLEDRDDLKRRTGGGSRFRQLFTADELRLDTQRSNAQLARERIDLPDPKKRAKPLRRMPDSLFLDYANGLLGAAKDWQDSLLSIMPGQYDRIVTIKLAPGEGGLNLTMPKARSELLMQLGYLAGRELVTGFDLSAHRVRRALASIQEIQRVALNFRTNWRAAGLDEQLRAADPPLDRETARHWKADRERVIQRFVELAEWAAVFDTKPDHGHQVRPRGSLRITPNLSGDL